MSPVALILTAPVSEFGDYANSAAFNDPFTADRDGSYVPGFSELRKARDTAVAEYVNHRGTKDAIQPLPVNMRWARNQKVTGSPDSTKPISHGNRGYRVTTKKDIGQDWLKAMPPGAELGVDGSIRKGDTVLMVCTQEQAAKNELQKRLKTERRVTGMTSVLATTAQNDHAGWKGADPTVKKESMSPITAPVAHATGK